MTHTWTVKNVKSFRGNEGLGFDASLYMDGTRVGYVVDDAWGGEFVYTIPKAIKAALDADVATLPTIVDPELGSLEPTADAFIAELVDRWELLRRIQAQLAKKVIFLNAEQKLRSLKVKRSDPRADAWFAKNCPDALILNDLPLEEAARHMAEDD